MHCLAEVTAVFDSPDFDDHEHVSFFSDEASGLRAIIAVHSTVPMGLAGGGCRMFPYAEAESALRDALRLSKAMSYKLALMGIPAGGAKSVIIGDPARDKSPRLLRAMGRAVHRLGGKYIAAEDSGTTPADIAEMAKETPYAMTGERGDGAESTAAGVVVAMELAVQQRLGRAGLRGTRVAIAGVGRVGYALARDLCRLGAVVTVADVDPRALERARAELGVDTSSPDDILAADVDVFAPCALGDVLDERTIPRLRCAVIAGSANNQLRSEAHADLLVERGILYCPDFVTNAGGVVGAARRGAAGVEAVIDAMPGLDRIREVLEETFARAEREGINPQAAATAMAKEKIRALR